MEEPRGGWPKYCFRQLPEASADIRGMFGGQVEDGRWGIIRKKREKSLDCRNSGGMAEIFLSSASVRFRGRPWTAAACVDGRWQMGDGELLGKTVKIPHKWKKVGRGGRNIASVIFRRLPRTSAACVGGRWKQGNY